MKVSLLTLLLACSCIIPDVASVEPTPVTVPAGLMEADVYARAGAPALIMPTSDGGKILVYETYTTYTRPGTTVDTTPSASTCVGNCGGVYVAPPRKTSVTTKSKTTEEKQVTTYTIAPDGHVTKITVTG